MPDPDAPSGVKLCECGCGQPAPISKLTNRAKGYVAGQPRRFVFAHHRRAKIGAPLNPGGLCGCGCGLPAPVATRNETKIGLIEGQPRRFISGHNARLRGRDPGANPEGMCQCGCGQLTKINDGQHARFLRGHAMRKSPVDYTVEDRGYKTPCWIWQLSRNPGGYGKTFANGKTVSAHRAYYERVNGPVPPGLELDHLCQVRPCIRPDHVEAVTKQVNLARRGRANRP